MSDCPVCYEPSNEWIDSVNSSCSHTLCITCFLNLSRTSEPLCPMCRADYRESILTFGDTSASAPRRLATRDAAFITAVTEAAAVAVEQRPVVIKATLDEFKMATDLYERQWLLIRSSEEMVRQYIVYASRSQHLIKYFDDALTELRRIRENDGYQKPELFLVSSVTAILETMYECAEGCGQIEEMDGIDCVFSILTKKYGSYHDHIPFEYKIRGIGD